MRSTLLASSLSLGVLGLATSPPSNGSQSDSSPVVSRAPDFVRPYVLPKYHGRAVKLTVSQVIRFSVTTNSTGGAFSLIQHTGKTSPWFSARAHTHQGFSEHFYGSKGQHLLWMQKNETGTVQEARISSHGDYAASPPNTIHNFQMVDPDSQITHVFSPAGFEVVFDEFSLGDFETTTGAAYLPVEESATSPFPPITNASAAVISPNDIQIYVNYTERRDLVNGAAGSPNLPWHNGPNTIPSDPTEPYFIAKDYGPRFLNVDNGYKIISPLYTPPNNTDNLTISTVLLSPKQANETLPVNVLPNHTALQLDEGQLVLGIEGYDTTALLQGDVAFLPAGTPFTYYATVPYTKFLLVSGGHEGLDKQLLANSRSWNYTSYPTHYGYKFE